MRFNIRQQKVGFIFLMNWQNQAVADIAVHRANPPSNQHQKRVKTPLFINLENSISILEKYELSISLSLLETQDKNFKFLFQIFLGSRQ